MKTTAVIVAAGSGRRLGAAIPKAFMILAGRPILDHSLAAFQDHPDVDAIVVVLPAGKMADGRRLAGRYAKVVATPEGGPRRQDSVLQGISCLDPAGSPDDIVLVHDAARPLVDAGIIAAVRAAAVRDGAAVPGVRPADTVRRIAPAADGGTMIAAGRWDRDAIVLVQTPQAFRVGILREAFLHAGEDDVTDDAALVERLGRPVAIIEGSARNFKITTPDDLRTAEALLA